MCEGMYGGGAGPERLSASAQNPRQTRQSTYKRINRWLLGSSLVNVNNLPMSRAWTAEPPGAAGTNVTISAGEFSPS